jgi:hypothetical protein
MATNVATVAALLLIDPVKPVTMVISVAIVRSLIGQGNVQLFDLTRSAALRSTSLKANAHAVVSDAKYIQRKNIVRAPMI